MPDDNLEDLLIEGGFESHEHLRAALDAEKDIREHRRKCQGSLISFCMATMPKYRPNWHHHLVAHGLEKLAHREISRLIIEVPVRHGKSELATIRFPAWYQGLYPANCIISANHTDDLCKRFGKQVRRLLKQKEYLEIFPDFTLQKDADAASEWTTMAGGEYKGVGVNAGVAGRGGDVLLADDIVKGHKDANSEIVRESTWDWWCSEFRERLNDEKGGICLIGNRWHDDDPTGRIIKEMENGGEKWTRIRIPAIAEEDSKYRSKGDALWPSRRSKEYLMQVKEARPDIFAAIFQQSPIIDGGAIFKEEWWQYFCEEEFDD